MRNLIRFINKYSFFFLFLIFEALAFYLLFRHNHFQQAAFLNSTNVLAGGLYSQYSELTDYLKLKEVNDNLSQENKRLRSSKQKAFHKLYGPNYLIDDTLYKRQYLYTKAKVINNSVNKQNNYLTLSVGSLNGVKEGMGVLSPNGIAGVVNQVSQHYSTVLSVLHSRAKISVKLAHTNYFGSLQWNGENHQMGELKDIPNHVSIKVGDTVLSSGYSATFPADLVVATIESFEKIEGENFYKIKVLFTSDFKNLSQVYVVKNIRKSEQIELEEKTEEKDG
ncbi:MAG: rod shape-determining protein MreC [Vicingaceae bacterium]